MNPLTTTLTIIYCFLFIGIQALAQPNKNPIQIDTYQPPSKHQLQTAYRLLSAHFQGYFDIDLQRQWQQLGYQVTHNKYHYHIKPINKYSRHYGEFAFNRQTTSHHLLQAPHRYADIGTGKIARQLFYLGNFQAIGWNSINRHTIDLAHETHTFMMAFTHAWQQHTSTGILVQIHGYDPNKRFTLIGKNSDIIISSGQTAPAPWLHPITQCLRDAWIKSYQYPTEIQELGGTKNAMAHQLANTRTSHFIHLELSRRLRKLLSQDKKALIRLNECLQLPIEVQNLHSWNTPR